MTIPTWAAPLHGNILVTVIQKSEHVIAYDVNAERIAVATGRQLVTWQDAPRRLEQPIELTLRWRIAIPLAEWPAVRKEVEDVGYRVLELSYFLRDNQV